MAASYAIDVRPILEDLGSTIAVEAPVDLPDLVIGSEEFTARPGSMLHLSVTNTGAGIVASGSVDASFGAVCSRCLADFELPVTAEIDAFYVSHGREHDLPEEQEYGFIQEGSVDLLPAVLASLALELPFAPLHDPECKGICPTCGTDRNVGSCDCPPAESASPFAVLKTLLADEDGDG
jgi:uncharacterized protein